MRIIGNLSCVALCVTISPTRFSKPSLMRTYATGKVGSMNLPRLHELGKLNLWRSTIRCAKETNMGFDRSRSGIGKKHRLYTQLQYNCPRAQGHYSACAYSPKARVLSNYTYLACSLSRSTEIKYLRIPAARTPSRTVIRTSSEQRR